MFIDGWAGIFIYVYLDDLLHFDYLLGAGFRRATTAVKVAMVGARGELGRVRTLLEWRGDESSVRVF